MPRTARIKSCNSIYHIMCRSISEVILFRDNKDKNKYLQLVKKYQDIFAFKVYCYCLMNTHCHIAIDANGADISKIFHGINQSYAHYFNKKYNRHGHVFQDRFKSKIVDKDSYLLVLSGYIHCNPISIKKYKNCIEKYQFSSLGVYLGIQEDNLNLIDKEFIMSHFSEKKIKAEKLYLEFVKNCEKNSISADIEFKDENTEYTSCRSILPRDHSIEKIIEFVVNKTCSSENMLKMKNCCSATEARALFVFLMRSLCNYSYKDICNIIGNLTESRVSSLCVLGMNLTKYKENYHNLIYEFINNPAA